MPRQRLELPGASLEVFTHDVAGQPGFVAAAHPGNAFTAGTAALLTDIAERSAVCINPRGLGGSSPAMGTSFEQTVDDIEAVRQRLALPPWVFWGMSGGGWLAQLYAHRHPTALAGIVVESACACFRERLADPTCALSPFLPVWRDELRSHDLLAEGSHSSPSSADDSEWVAVAGVGQVFKRRGGPALLVSPVAVDADMQRAMPTFWTFDSRGWLGELRTPTLVIAGDADPVVPVARAREVHEAIAGSSFAVVPGGHVPSSQRTPEAVAAIRSFLAGIPKPSLPAGERGG